MFSGTFGRRTLAGFCMAVAVVIFAAPAFAQSGRIQGKITDAAGNPVEGVKVTASNFPDTTGQTWEAKTDKNGNYLFGTLSRAGGYIVKAEKAGVGTAEDRVTVRLADFATLNLKLSNAVRVSDEQAKKNAAGRKFFDGGMAASAAGNPQGAVEQFTQAAEVMAPCPDCYYNLGVSQSQLKNYEAAETAYKKAIELRPTYQEAYTALASVYTMERKTDLAAEAATKAAELSTAAPGGGNADSLYAAGVGLWNANQFPQAQKQFEDAIKLNPNHAESHFMLAKALLNGGKLAEAAAEYDAYLKLAPTGKNAAEAKTTYDALKPMLK